MSWAPSRSGDKTLVPLWSSRMDMIVWFRSPRFSSVHRDATWLQMSTDALLSSRMISSKTPERTHGEDASGQMSCQSGPLMVHEVFVYLVLCSQRCPGAAPLDPVAEGPPAERNMPRLPTRWPLGPAEALSAAGGGRGWASDTEPICSPLRERERDSSTDVYKYHLPFSRPR